MYRGFLFFCISLLFCSFFALAEPADTGAQFQNALENASGVIEKTQEVLDAEKVDNLGTQWRELLRNNKYIKPFDEAFTALDGGFVVLFARHYSLSLSMFFAFLMWLFTFFWVVTTAAAFFPDVTRDFAAPAVGLVIATIIAHTQLFNNLSEAAVKVMFYKSSVLWSIITFIFLIVILVLYLYFGRLLGKYFKNMRQLEEKHKLENEVAVEKMYREAQSKARS